MKFEIIVAYNLKEYWCLYYRMKHDIVGYINQEKNATKIKASHAVHKHTQILLHCDKSCP